MVKADPNERAIVVAPINKDPVPNLLSIQPALSLKFAIVSGSA